MQEELRKIIGNIWATEQLFTKVFAGPYYILKWVRVMHKYEAMPTHEALNILHNHGFKGKDLEL